MHMSYQLCIEVDCLSGFEGDPSQWVQPLTRRLVPLVCQRLAPDVTSCDLGLSFIPSLLWKNQLTLLR